MVKCPIIRHDKLAAVYSLTRKFNDNLESVLADDRHLHILKVQVPMDADPFDNWG